MDRRRRWAQVEASMSVAIVLSPLAYLPEAYAYRDCLLSAGMEARIVADRGALTPSDTAICFAARDIMQRSLVAKRRIHEYHGLSQGRLGWLKNFAKVAFAPLPDGVVTLKGPVSRYLAGRLDSRIPRLERRMGIDPAIFDCARDRARKRFDLVYCGSLGRAGLVEALFDLTDKGFTIICFGRVPSGFPASSLGPRGVEFGGVISRDEVPDALALGRAGLVVTPDRPPLNLQESRKSLEYVAAGLPVLSNRHRWMEDFARQDGVVVEWLNNLRSADDLAALHAPGCDIRHRAWPNVLKRCGFADFVGRIDA